MENSISLKNYRFLVERVDRFWAGVVESCAGQLACREGCDACCTHFGVSSVEGVALALALHGLSPEDALLIRERAQLAERGTVCPLLGEKSCLLYRARPIICRTQGLPLLVTEDVGQRIDHCPLNFTGVTALPGGVVLDLETLNRTLAAINMSFLAELGGALPERMSIGEALLLEFDH
ncbi:MAG: YkgJ family cysteine cluster protein [Desulfuromonadales bacterium]|nr:YkgJ family cysteine cluster protein [Desulfuromonadales bacterium]